MATRLHHGGYRTGLFGKYMNGYRYAQNYVGPGWDRWVSYIGAGTGHTPPPFNIEGRLRYGITRADRFSASHCKSFITNNAKVPWFAVYAATAPHGPYRPTAEHADDYNDVRWNPPAFNEADMTDKPPWMQDLPL